MSTAGPLSDRPKTELANLARRRGVRGWETMNKEALIKALSRTPAKTAKPTPKAKVTKPTKPVKTTKPKVVPKSAARVVSKPTPKGAKPTAKPTAKPAAKSAAKVTRPAKPAVKPAARSASPVVNGTHRTATAPPAALANGTPKATGKPGAVPPSKPGAAVPGKPAVAGKSPAKPTAPVKSGAKPAVAKDIPPPRPSVPQPKDRVILAVNDPYWLHVMWDLSTSSMQRAEAALKQDWYGAKRIIRLFDVTSQDTTSTSETPIRDISIDGDGRNWYINVAQPPRQYRADVGYLSRRGDFFPLARSNVVTPPKAGSPEALDAGWEKDPKKAERILAMSTGFEKDSHPELKELFVERYGPLGPPRETAFGTGATLPAKLKKFDFEIGAKLIVFGRTDPTAHVTLGNDPIDLDSAGRFTMEFGLPDSRQIIPAVATSADGVEERTIVLAVERNTKYLDPMIHDQMNEV
jgi:hypothetical protein